MTAYDATDGTWNDASVTTPANGSEYLTLDAATGNAKVLLKSKSGGWFWAPPEGWRQWKKPVTHWRLL